MKLEFLGFGGEVTLMMMQSMYFNYCVKEIKRRVVISLMVYKRHSARVCSLSFALLLIYLWPWHGSTIYIP